MPKATLEFSLPEERSEFDDCLAGSSWQIVMWDLKQWLRDNYKWDKGDISVDAADKVSCKINELMEEYNIKFSE